MGEARLAELLTFTRDGEWGQGEPGDGYVPMQVVRGTDFEKVRFGDLTTLPVRYIREDIAERKQLQVGDVLLETAGGTKDQPTGRTVCITERTLDSAALPLTCASFARFLRPDPQKIDSEYLFWKLQAEYASGQMLPFHIQHTGVARFQYTQFANSHSLSIPDKVSEQRRLVAVLTALDNKIELNRRMNETLEAMARAIFRDWFVDYGPTRSKMDGREPYLAPDLWALFPGRLDDGKPEGWEMGTLSDLFLLQRGFDLPKSKRSQGAYPVLAASGIVDYHSEFMVRGPGVTTGRSGVLGKVFFVHDDFWPLNTSLWVKEFKASSPLHAYFLISSLGFSAYNAGSAVPTLNRNHVHTLPQVLPPQALISEFDAAVAPLLQLQRHNDRASETLAATRDLLLPKLMSGEIRVAEAAELADEAIARGGPQLEAGASP